MATLDTQLAGASRSAMAAVKNAEPKPATAPNGAPTAEVQEKKPVVKVAPKPARKRATDRTLITQPKPAGKKAVKKAAKPQYERKTPVPYSDDAEVKTLKTDHGLRGNRGAALDALLKSQSLGKFKAALVKHGGRMRSYYSFALKRALELKLVAIREAKEAAK